MASAEQKVLQYLTEAHASEQALIRVLESQIAVAPRGSLRAGLVRHLDETKNHASRIAERLSELGQGGQPLLVAFGLIETVVGQVLALSKTPFDLVRGSGGAEKVLKNAKDACATEALEIATYTAIERVAELAGDETTAALAASIREDEQAMLDRLLAEIPRLTQSVIDGSYRVADTGAGEAVQQAGKSARRAVRRTRSSAKRNVRKVPGVVQAEGEVRGAAASERDLPIARYDSLTAADIRSKLGDLSQLDLARIGGYERSHQARSTLLDRIASLQSEEPWAGYDQLTVPEVKAVLDGADESLAKRIHSYEDAHKARAGVLQAAAVTPATA